MRAGRRSTSPELIEAPAQALTVLNDEARYAGRGEDRDEQYDAIQKASQ
jgi:hypothetical protein